MSRKGTILGLLLVLAAGQAQRVVGLVEVSRHGLRTPLVRMQWAYVEQEEPGALTKEGEKQKFEHGLALRKNYSELFGSRYDSDRIYARATNYSRTIASLQAQLQAIYPASHSFSIDVHSSDAALLPHSSCPRIREIRTKDQLTSPSHIQLLAEINANRAEIQPLAGELTFDSVFDMSDVLVNYMERGLQVPATKSLLLLANQVYTHALWLWSGNTEQRRLGVIVLLQEVIRRFQVLARGEDVPAVALYCAHDITLVPLLHLFAVEDTPGPGAFLQFQLWKDENLTLIRVSYNGNWVHFPGCPYPCSLTAFTASLNAYMLPDEEAWERHCEIGWGYSCVLGLLVVSLLLFYLLKRRISTIISRVLHISYLHSKNN